MSIDLTNHLCENLVLRCIDFRFRKQIDEELEKQIGQFDCIAIAGASKRISKIIEDIKIAIEKHGVKKFLYC